MVKVEIEFRTRFFCMTHSLTTVALPSSFFDVSASDEITHMLHVSKELLPPIERTADMQGSVMDETNEDNS
jgi:hypothetical protein